jgi:hypothetical protein
MNIVPGLYPTDQAIRNLCHIVQMTDRATPPDYDPFPGFLCPFQRRRQNLIGENTTLAVQIAIFPLQLRGTELKRITVVGKPLYQQQVICLMVESSHGIAWRKGLQVVAKFVYGDLPQNLPVPYDREEVRIADVIQNQNIGIERQLGPQTVKVDKIEHIDALATGHSNTGSNGPVIEIACFLILGAIHLRDQQRRIAPAFRNVHSDLRTRVLTERSVLTPTVSEQLFSTLRRGQLFIFLKTEVYRQPGALSFVVPVGSGVSENPLLKKDSSFLFEQSI